MGGRIVSSCVDTGIDFSVEIIIRARGWPGGGRCRFERPIVAKASDAMAAVWNRDQATLGLRNGVNAGRAGRIYRPEVRIRRAAGRAKSEPGTMRRPGSGEKVGIRCEPDAALIAVLDKSEGNKQLWRPANWKLS